MLNPATVRERRLRKTKAQLIDEIDTLEAAHKSSAPLRAKANDRYLAKQELADLARFPSENPNPVLRVMPDGAVLYANDAAIAVNGLLKGRKKSALARDLASVVAEASRTAEVLETEFESVDRVFAFSIAAVTGETYTNIYGRDITDHRRAEEERRSAEARLRDAIGIMTDGFAVYDSEGRLVHCNDSFRDLHRYSEADTEPSVATYDSLGQVDAAHGTLGRQPLSFVQRLAKLRQAGSNKTIDFIGDRIHERHVSATPEGGIISIVTDITERKRAEAELAEKEAQLRVALDHMPGGMTLEDRDGIYVLFNSQYSELQDYPEGFLKVGMSAREEVRFQAKRGDFGPGKKDELVEQVLDLYQEGNATSWERTFSNGRTLRFNVAPTPEGGYATILTDITERKRAEAELAKKEAQLRVALDHMPGGMALEDRDGNYVLFNTQYSELLGFPDGLARIGGSLRDAMRYQADRGDYGPGDKDDLIEQVNATYQRGETTDYERTIAGSGRALRFNVAPTPEGGYVSIVTDITERKRVEAELAEKEAQLRAALDNMPGGIRLIDGNRNFVLSNQQYLDLFDLPEGLLKAGDSIRVENLYCAQRGDMGPGDPETLVDEWLSDAPEQTERAGWEFTLEGGKVLQVRTSPLPDRGVVNVVTDITERKRAEQELAESKERLQALADYMQVALSSMSDGIYILDGDLNIFAFNQRYVDLLDFPEGLVREGGPIVDVVEFAAKRGDYGSQFDGDVDGVVAGRLKQIGSNERYSTEHITPTGRIVEFRGSPIKGGGFVTIMHDITERKRAEEALLAAKRRSEDASKEVAEKNRMLESLSNQLSKYLSPQVYASIFSGEQSVEIASKRKKLTVFFSDIADFTGITDSLESEELTNLLNHYLTEMSKIALDCGATIDKYVGDSIIAFFGDPETRGVKEDAKACVNMAIAMQRRMRELRSEWLDLGLERPFELRIGINTGFCTVGNFGSAERMDYTIIGNEVNLAARLESRAEVGGILMAHETHALVKGTVLAEEGDTLTVKGFAKPVRTYSVVGLYDDLAEQGRIIRKEQDGLSILLDLDKQDRARAIEAVEDVLSQLKG